MTIVEFLNARLDEDAYRLDLAAEAEAEALRHDGMPDTTAQEIKAFWLDPETGTEWPRTLADIAAKRAIIQRYQNACRHADDVGEDEAVRSEWGVIASTYEQVLCEHASVYSGHEEYQQEWKP